VARAAQKKAVPLGLRKWEEGRRRVTHLQRLRQRGLRVKGGKRGGKNAEGDPLQRRGKGEKRGQPPSAC